MHACRRAVLSKVFCTPGYYCPENSTSSRMFPCGSEDLYCPLGSALPTPVSKGYYTTVGLRHDGIDDPKTALVRDSQRECPPGTYCVGGIKRKCPAGKYGSTRGLSNRSCSGACHPGYFCKEGAHSGKESKCGATGLYCPEGSFEPTPVTSGYWTISGGPLTRANQSICPAGYFCSIGIRRKCPKGRFGATAGLDSKGHIRMPARSYCPIASIVTLALQGVWQPTVFLLLHARLSAGWYCPIGSTSSQQEECGGEDVYCPMGATAPVPTDEGYFAVDGTIEYLRQNQVLCDGDAAFSALCPKTTI